MVKKRTMLEQSAADFLPEKRTLPALREAASHCEGCELYKRATMTVFGEGETKARVILIGEQPGNEEDRAGRPFVGPAGRLLDEALEEAGIDRELVYVTNAVKHFKWEPRGKHRLHAKPSAREMAACRPWLEAEIELIQPLALVCLGATAAQSLMGSSFRITKQRGQVFETEWSPWTMATYHPAALLRAPEKAQRDAMRADFIADLKKVAEKLEQP